MKRKTMAISLFFAAIFLNGCMTVPFMRSRATIGYTTAIHKELITLPSPKEKIVAAVYSFRDQTGQYKANAQAASFSTAVTQGATSMLIKALEDSNWFVSIEREGLSNLLNERKIIRSTQESINTAKKSSKEDQLSLPPLLYASVIIEGGIIAYDTNLVTGGFGAKYFGLSGSAQTRRDQVTIYLRVVSVKSGRILKSVSTTKSILSRMVDFGVFRFVRVKRLLEVETGFSTNEPVEMCVLEAVERGVRDLVIEGIVDKIWELENPADFNSSQISEYLKEKEENGGIIVLKKKDEILNEINKKKATELEKTK
ncbi:MAG: Uncharacterized protein Athens101426_635 [Parcubacteria group bacterium Athens1014_26]|nr:MAG: Uncharacterized protein Athens101426_635 [Parcubacteria group bacterium Athens1014_26]